jgi:hypothetical protein
VWEVQNADEVSISSLGNVDPRPAHRRWRRPDHDVR